MWARVQYDWVLIRRGREDTERDSRNVGAQREKPREDTVKGGRLHAKETGLGRNQRAHTLTLDLQLLAMVAPANECTCVLQVYTCVHSGQTLCDQHSVLEI